jgi:hypothetical protein
MIFFSLEKVKKFVSHPSQDAKAPKVVPRGEALIPLKVSIDF